MTFPSPLGAQRTFGFGDRFGFAARAHLAVSRESGFAPIFAQQSAIELAQSGRTPAEMLATAPPDLDRAWGADAAGVAMAPEIEPFATAGFSRFTLDPSAYFVERAADLSAAELDAAASALVEDGVFAAGWVELYAGREFPISESRSLRIEFDALQRVAVKFGWALAFAEELTAHAKQVCGARPFEVELSLLRSATRTTPQEHLFVALEARRRGLPLVAIAPHLPGSWEPMAEAVDDADELEAALQMHTAIAGAYGPHQISVPEIEGKSAILPVLGRVCGARLHVKTSAASALEMLRVVARVEPGLFREILGLAQERFPFERSVKPGSLSEEEVRFLPEAADPELETLFLGDARGRQLLDVTIGSIWATGVDSSGRPMKERLAELMGGHQALYDDLLAAHLRTLLDALG